MTDPTPASRFIVRRDTPRNTWLIWDKKMNRPAQLERGPAVRLSQEAARLMRERLERAHPEE